jgi:hypothetical protein
MIVNIMVECEIRIVLKIGKVEFNETWYRTYSLAFQYAGIRPADPIVEVVGRYYLVSHAEACLK